MGFISVVIRTLFFYIFILVSLRIMGRRELSKLSVSDFTISLLIAELVAISIENKDDNLLFTLLPIVLLVFLEVLSSYIELKFNKIRKFVDGSPSIIIDNGKLNIKEMKKQRFGIEDLLLSLRSNGITSISDVAYAILEINGNLSIIRESDKTYPFPLILDGKINKSALKSINKDIRWVNMMLDLNGYKLKDIFCAFYKNNKLYVIKK